MGEINWDFELPVCEEPLYQDPVTESMAAELGMSVAEYSERMRWQNSGVREPLKRALNSALPGTFAYTWTDTGNGGRTQICIKTAATATGRAPVSAEVVEVVMQIAAAVRIAEHVDIRPVAATWDELHAIQVWYAEQAERVDVGAPQPFGMEIEHITGSVLFRAGPSETRTKTQQQFLRELTAKYGDQVTVSTKLRWVANG